MQFVVPGEIAEMVELVVELLVTVVLMLLGVGAELNSVQAFGSNLTMALWFGYIGMLALYVGVVKLGQERLVPHLRSRYATDG